MSGDEKVAPRINLCLLKPVARPSPRRPPAAPVNPNPAEPAAGSIKGCTNLYKDSTKLGAKMSKCQVGFFETKKEWSRIKDKLLRAYLPAYFTKMITSSRRTLYIDCFAGAGEFQDGEPGSPKIAMEERAAAFGRSKTCRGKIDVCFIEPKYARQLNEVVKSCPQRAEWGSVRVVEGTFQDSINELLSGARDANVFLYIDPFGIKYLNFDLIGRLQEYCGRRLEVLVNFNSFGFVRNGCRACQVNYPEIDGFDELEERDLYVFDDSANSVKLLSKIVGGDYWKLAITQLKKNQDLGERRPAILAEKEIMKGLHYRLLESFKYVLNIPVCIKTKSFPKYRLVHMTNHEDGCVLMAEDMSKRSEEIYNELQGGSQMLLGFQMDAEQEFISEEKIRELVSDGLFEYASNWVQINEFLGRFYSKNGVVAPSSSIRNALRQMEKSGILEVLRFRDGARITGRFWTVQSGLQLLLKKK